MPKRQVSKPAFVSEPAEVAPAASEALTDAPAAPRPRRSFGWAAMAALGFLAVGLVGGFYAGQEYGRASETVDTGQSWIDQVALYQKLLTRASVRDFAEDPSAKAELETRLGNQLDMVLAIPDMSQLEMAFAGGQILSVNDRPVAQLLYLPPSGAPVAVFITPRGGGDRNMIKGREYGLNLFSWRQDGFAYAVIGKARRQDLRELATAVRHGGKKDSAQ